jgi:uncharacterized protein YggE
MSKERRSEMSTDDIQRTISVTGTGQAAAPADLLVLRLAVETQAVTASDALTENNKRVAAVLSALKDHGIQKKDIQTTELRIDPVTDDAHPPKIVGYQVQNGLSVNLRDIQGAGVLIDAAVQAGGDATRIESISFSFADPSSLLVKARKRAIDDAKDRAQQLAAGLGVKLGNVTSISESETSGGPRLFAAVAGPATPILPGVSEVTDQVTVSYEISD